jgi:hypothetical protein
MVVLVCRYAVAKIQILYRGRTGAESGLSKLCACMKLLPSVSVFIRLAASIGALLCFTPVAVAVDERKAISASALIEMIGVNVHMRYNDGAYRNSQSVLQGLQYLGIRNIRDQMPGTGTQADMQARDTLRRMAFGGIRSDLIYSNGWLPSQAIELVRNLEKAVPRSVEFVEGYNEINNFPVAYEGLSGAEGAAAGQRALYRAIKGDPDLKPIRVIDMTGLEEIANTTFRRGPSLEGYADVMNLHVYAQNGLQPGIWINPEKSSATKLIEQPPAKAITEFGYASMPQSGWLVIGVDERTQAKGLLNGIFDAAKSGYEKLYIYELLDQKPDPQGQELQFHFGLFTFDNRPKLAAQAIRNLTQVLRPSDSKGSVSGYQDRQNPEPKLLAPPPIQLAVQPTTDEHRIYTLSVVKSDGTLLAAAWQEPAFWDRASGQPREASGVRANLSFGKPCSAVRLYDVLQSSEPISVSREETLSLIIGDHVQLVECVNP